MTGQQLDAHTVCKSEAEKYFGKFYQGNGDKGKAGSGNGQTGGKNEGKTQGKGKGEDKKGSGDGEEGKVKGGKWRGWKNEIKNVLKEQSDGIEKKKLKKVVVKRFVECCGDKSNLGEIFETKVGFRRFVELDGRIYYYRFLKDR